MTEAGRDRAVTRRPSASQRGTQGAWRPGTGPRPGQTRGTGSVSDPRVGQAHRPVLRAETRKTERSPREDASGHRCCYSIYSREKTKSTSGKQITGKRPTALRAGGARAPRSAWAPVLVSGAEMAGTEASGQKPCHCSWAPASDGALPGKPGPHTPRLQSRSSPALTAGCGTSAPGAHG